MGSADPQGVKNSCLVVRQVTKTSRN